MKLSAAMFLIFLAAMCAFTHAGETRSGRWALVGAGLLATAYFLDVILARFA